MKLFTAMLATICLFSSAPTKPQTIMITRAGSRAVRPGPAESFTGGVRVEMLFEAVDPSHASGGSVAFEAGACCEQLPLDDLAARLARLVSRGNAASKGGA